MSSDTRTATAANGEAANAGNAASDAEPPWAAAALTIVLTIFAVLVVSFVAVVTGLV